MLGEYAHMQGLLDWFLLLFLHFGSMLDEGSLMSTFSMSCVALVGLMLAMSHNLVDFALIALGLQNVQDLPCLAVVRYHSLASIVGPRVRQ